MVTWCWWVSFKNIAFKWWKVKPSWWSYFLFLFGYPSVVPSFWTCLESEFPPYHLVLWFAVIPKPDSNPSEIHQKPRWNDWGDPTNSQFGWWDTGDTYHFALLGAFYGWIDPEGCLTHFDGEVEYCGFGQLSSQIVIRMRPTARDMYFLGGVFLMFGTWIYSYDLICFTALSETSLADSAPMVIAHSK